MEDTDNRLDSIIDIDGIIDELETEFHQIQINAEFEPPNFSEGSCTNVCTSGCTDNCTHGCTKSC